MDFKTLRNAIDSCAAVAKNWFLEHSTQKNRADWQAKGQLGDNGIGAVYAFFDATGNCLYVGQTTQTLKQRANVQTSCHYQTVWWQSWQLLRFVNTSNQTDQLILEALLILALSPPYNTKPAARQIDQMFGDLGDAPETARP